MDVNLVSEKLKDYDVVIAPKGTFFNGFLGPKAHFICGKCKGSNQKNRDWRRVPWSLSDSKPMAFVCIYCNTPNALVNDVKGSIIVCGE